MLFIKPGITDDQNVQYKKSIASPHDNIMLVV